MKVHVFTYKQGKVRELRKFSDGERGSIAGIDMSSMTEDERKAFIAIEKKHEAELEPFMKHYRNFLLAEAGPILVSEIG